MGLLLATGALKKKVPAAPPPRTLEEEGRTTLEAQKALYPLQSELDRMQAIDQGNLTSDVLNNFITKLGPVADQQAAQSATAQRTADISDVEQLGPRAIAAFRNANPEQAALLDELNRQAGEGLRAGGDLTDAESRAIQQNVRGAQAARGMGFGKPDVYSEILAQYGARNEREAQRRGFAGQVLGYNNTVADIPFQTVLGRPVVGGQQGQAYAQQGLQTANANRTNTNPFDNSYAADLNNTNFNAAYSNRFAAQNYNAAVTGALIGAIGSIVGGGARGAAGGV